jgi:hypothetical protein
MEILKLNMAKIIQCQEDKDMAKARLLGSVEMAEIEARLANMGKELYQIVEDYPALPDWTYAALLMFMHQRIYDKAVELKMAAILKDKEAAAGNGAEITVNFDHISALASTQVS